MIIKVAEEGDRQAIETLLEELDIGHSSLCFGLFLVAVVDGEVAGIAHLEDCGASFYLSAVGVRADLQGMGLGRELIDGVTVGLNKPVHIYTRIPAFFRKVGFVPCEQPSEIPPREMYDCDKCDAGKDCICMVKMPHVSALS